MAENKSINCIYYGFSDENQLFIIEHLQKKYHWQPKLIAGYNHRKSSLEKYEANDCIMADAMKLRQVDLDYSNLSKPRPVDAEILSKISLQTLNFLGFLPDTTGWNYSFEQRKEHFYRILNYWNTALEKIKPDLIVFFTWPHTSACHSLYLLAKHHFGIKTLFIDPVPLFDSNCHIIGSSLDCLHEPFIDIYNNSNELTPGETGMEYLQKLRGEHPASPEYIQETYRKDKQLLYSQLKNLTKVFFWHLYKGYRFAENVSGLEEK